MSLLCGCRRQDKEMVSSCSRGKLGWRLTVQTMNRLKHQNRLPRETVNSLPLEMFKSRLERQLAGMVLSWAGNWTRWHCEVPFSSSFLQCYFKVLWYLSLWSTKNRIQFARAIYLISGSFHWHRKLFWPEPMLLNMPKTLWYSPCMNIVSIPGSLQCDSLWIL